MAGYSKTPLAKKLGFKAGFRVRVQNEPPNYRQMVEPLPADVHFLNRLSKEIDIVHLFVNAQRDLERWLGKARDCIRLDGMIWVSWPKKSSGVKSDVTEDTIRQLALDSGLVDIKVCAVDDIWSGLKLVIPKELRK